MRFRIVVIAALLLAASAAAQEFPAKAVRVVVPWPPSGPPDLLARLAAPKMSDQWGKPVIVENRAGATGTIGTDAVAKSGADGYTVLVTSSQPFVLAPALFSTPYDPARDLLPVAVVAEDVNVLVVNPRLGLNSVAELVAFAKANPGKLTFGSSGVGSIAHMSGELTKQAAGIDVLHVPYQGAAPVITALLAGEVSMGFPPVFQALPHIRTGKLKALGVTGTRPSGYLPDVQPLAAQGLGELVSANWYAFFVPAHTPRAVVATLRDAVQKAVQDPAVRQKLDAAGMEPRWQESADVTAAIESDLARWRRVVQKGNIKAQ